MGENRFLEVFGFLFLTERGEWSLREGKVVHPNLRGYLCRSYQYDPQSCAMVVFVGNQKIFVDLEYTPWIYRIQSHGSNFQILTHTERSVSLLKDIYMDEKGNLLFLTEYGIGKVHDQDLYILEPFFQDERLFVWKERAYSLQFLPSHKVPRVFGYQNNPRPPRGENRDQPIA